MWNEFWEKVLGEFWEKDADYIDWLWKHFSTIVILLLAAATLAWQYL